MAISVGILTAGGDTPGLNAALRGLGKSAHSGIEMQLIGFYDGFNGLLHDRTKNLDESSLSGILTAGGTILGTSRDKPHRMPIGGKVVDMTDAMVETYHRHHLDVLVCIGGGGTHKNAYRLMQKGLNILTIPKSIDNDLVKTDVTLGFNTALGVATDAIDRLHSTAHSHHRIILVELMGHNAGWLTLGAGLAGGADVILIPEIPYDAGKVGEAILERSRKGKRFSIVAVSEGAMSIADAAVYQDLLKAKEKAGDSEKKEAVQTEILEFFQNQTGKTMRLAGQLEAITGLESRVTILGYVQRGGTPSSLDRLLATELGSSTAALIYKGVHGVMVAVRGNKTAPVALEKVVGKRRTVPLDHPWIETARRVETCLGD
jgi:6-phosphofructokinase